MINVAMAATKSSTPYNTDASSIDSAPKSKKMPAVAKEPCSWRMTQNSPTKVRMNNINVTMSYLVSL